MSPSPGKRENELVARLRPASFTTEPAPPRRAAALGPVAWKAVALPTEHGGWGLLGEPIVLGLVLAPAAAGACLALSAGAAFLARHPLRLVFLDRRRGVRYPRTALAERFFAGYALAATALLALALALAPAAFWPALVAAAPIALASLAYDVFGRSREALPEAMGAVALSGACAAIALAGGAPAPVAFAAWVLLALRSAGSVLYVRARIRLDRGLPAGPGLVLAGHAAALALVTAMATARVAPWLAVVAFAVLLARAGWGLSRRRRPVRPRQLGLRELGYGVLTLVLVSVGYLAGTQAAHGILIR
jgi:hypothetical protein